jgi:hypothetical protein
MAWEPEHITPDQVLEVVLKCAQWVGITPEKSTPLFGFDEQGQPMRYSDWSEQPSGLDDPQVWDFMDLMSELEGSLRLYPPSESPGRLASGPGFSPSDDDLAGVAVLGDLVGVLGKYIRIANEAHGGVVVRDPYGMRPFVFRDQSVTLEPSDLPSEPSPSLLPIKNVRHAPPTTKAPTPRFIERAIAVGSLIVYIGLLTGGIYLGQAGYPVHGLLLIVIAFVGAYKLMT